MFYFKIELLLFSKKNDTCFRQDYVVLLSFVLGFYFIAEFINLLFSYIFNQFIHIDDLVLEKERYKDIGDDLDTAFVELILKE